MDNLQEMIVPGTILVITFIFISNMKFGGKILFLNFFAIVLLYVYTNLTNH